MKHRIRLLVLLMAACTLALTGLQAYWNYQAYSQATRTFRRDANEALAEAAHQEMHLHQAALLQRYRGWLADTNAVVIRSSKKPQEGTTIFYLADRHPYRGEKRQPYDIGFRGYVRPSHARDSTGRAFFIRRFLAGPVTNDLRDGMTYFYTRSLGDKLFAAYQADTVYSRRLARLYGRALRQRDIATGFHFQFGAARPPLATSATYATAATTISLGQRPNSTVRAWFPDPNQVYLRRMKWVLLGSVGLIGIVIFCFAYTVRVLLSQERLAELKNDFVNNMTHELKTPVATIGVTAEAMERFALGPEDSAEYLGIIREQASRLGVLIDKILQSVVAEQATQALACQPLDLTALLSQVLVQAQPRLSQAGSSLRYDAPPAPLLLTGDAVHLANVLTTLLDNALKYGHPAGALTLGCGVCNGLATICLTNEGPSIPAQYQERIFEKFFRVPTGNRHDVPGYGLGLHYARTVVERHGGTLAVQSQAGHTTFTISLPLTNVPTPLVAAGR